MAERRVGPPRAVPGRRSWPNDHDHENCYYRTSAACTGFGRASQPQQNGLAAAERAVRASKAAAARRKTRQRRIDRILLALFLAAAVAVAWYIHLHGLSGGSR
jgi:ferric-dicitrate binding protein FerR (iron transport regulator)